MHWPPLWLSPGKSNYTGKYLGCQSRDTKKLPNYYSAWARLTSWRQNLMTLIYICLLYSQISVSFYSITSCQMNSQKIWPNIFERSGKKKFGEALHFFCFCIFLHFRCPRSFLSLVSLSFRFFVFIQTNRICPCFCGIARVFSRNTTTLSALCRTFPTATRQYGMPVTR